MPRKKVIDRDKVLDAAEEIILDRGLARFTLDAVAERAGISKGGLVYTFATKDELLRAMIARELERFADTASARAAAEFSGARHPQLLGHIATDRDTEDAVNQRAANMLIALISMPDTLQPSRDYISTMIDSFDLTAAEGRRARLALMATMGVFFMRRLSFAEMPAQDWRAILDDAMALYEGRL